MSDGTQGRIRDLENEVAALRARVTTLETGFSQTRVVRVLDVPPVGQTGGACDPLPKHGLPIVARPIPGPSNTMTFERP